MRLAAFEGCWFFRMLPALLEGSRVSLCSHGQTGPRPLSVQSAAIAVHEVLNRTWLPCTLPQPFLGLAPVLAPVVPAGPSPERN